MSTSPHGDTYADLEPSIGDRLRTARERRTSYDQGDFADRIGVSRGTVSNYERDKLPGGPRQRLVLNAWAAECRVSRKWLETGTAAPHGPDGGGSVTGGETTPSARVVPFIQQKMSPRRAQRLAAA